MESFITRRICLSKYLIKSQASYRDNLLWFKNKYMKKLRLFFLITCLGTLQIGRSTSYIEIQRMWGVWEREKGGRAERLGRSWKQKQTTHLEAIWIVWNYFTYTTLNCWGMINLGFVLTGVICYYFWECLYCLSLDILQGDITVNVLLCLPFFFVVRVAV